MTKGFSIDPSRGEMISTVSAQWARRPADQRFTSLTELREKVATWAEHSAAHLRETKDIRVAASDGGELVLVDDDEPKPLTNHSFAQLARIAQAPSRYLATLAPELAAVNLNYGLAKTKDMDASLYIRDEVDPALRAVTSPTYGRILDRDVVDAVQKIAGDGVGDTRWKVPGCIDWNSAHGITHNPHVDVSKQNTTLYASDRDVFIFLVDDMNPIEVGKLDNGEPDLMFRGFYVWNSEVGSRTFGMATMYLRGVCMNRNLWGVEGFSETIFRHTSGAPERFESTAVPALESFSNANTRALLEGVQRAKETKVSVTDEERIEFLTGVGFSAKQAAGLIQIGLREEGHPPETIWDHAQAITASARSIPHQNERVAMERIAGKVLELAD